MTGRTSLIALAVTACAVAAGSTDETTPPPAPARSCGTVTALLCDDLARQLADGRQQVSEQGGSGKFSLKLPAFGIGAEGSGQVSSQSVALSPERIESLSVAVTACAAAVRVPIPATIEAFWSKLGQSIGAELSCVADGSAPPLLDPPPTAAAPTPRSAVTVPVPKERPPEGVQFDLDLGVPIGVHVGYDFGRHGVGVRAAVGPAFYASSFGSFVPVGLLAAFAAIGVDGDGRWQIEPTVGVGVYSLAGFLAGLDLHRQFTDSKAARGPGIGSRVGLDVTVISGSPMILPEAALVLSW